MPPKKRAVRATRVVRRRAPVRRVMGRGFMDWVNKAKDFVKSNQLLSKGASALGYNDVAGTLRNYGYGRKRVMRRRQPAMRRTGRGFMDWVNKAKDFVKSNQLLSKGASALGYNDVAGTLRNAGYGRRKRMGGMKMLSPPFMGGKRRVGGRIIFPAVYTTGLGGLSATTY